jgi:hypothetical protein
MLRRSTLVIALAASLGACTSLASQRLSEGEPPVYPPAAFSHRVGTTHVVLYWNCLQPEPGIQRLDGVAHSPYFSEVRYLEFELVGVDANERVVSQTKGAAGDYVLRTNQDSPFQLDLRTVGSEVRFDLYYSYRSQQSLRSLLAGPPVSEPDPGYGLPQPWRGT